jgi:hypothetical protein
MSRCPRFFAVVVITTILFHPQISQQLPYLYLILSSLFAADTACQCKLTAGERGEGDSAKLDDRTNSMGLFQPTVFMFQKCFYILTGHNQHTTLYTVHIVYSRFPFSTIIQEYFDVN